MDIYCFYCYIISTKCVPSSPTPNHFNRIGCTYSPIFSDTFYGTEKRRRKIQPMSKNKFNVDKNVIP